MWLQDVDTFAIHCPFDVPLLSDDELSDVFNKVPYFVHTPSVCILYYVMQRSDVVGGPYCMSVLHVLSQIRYDALVQIHQKLGCRLTTNAACSQLSDLQNYK